MDDGKEAANRNHGLSLPWCAALLGLAVAGWWAYPWVRPRGFYAGHYRFTDIEFGAVATLIWLAVTAVALCPVRLRRPVGIRLGVVLSAGLLALAACDLGATLWTVYGSHFWYARESFPLRENQRDPDLIWRHRPFISWHGRKTPDCQEIDFRTDEHGFRNPPGIERADLAFVGDSVTEAGEVSEEATFVRKAADGLHASAVNLGMFRFGPQQELNVLKQYALAYRPRVVVWQVTEWNDLFDAETYVKFIEKGPKPLSWSFRYEKHSPVVKLITALFPPQRRNVVNFERTDGTIERRMIWPFFNPAPACPVGLDETRRTLATAQALCRERGITLVVLLVPSQSRVLGPYVRPSHSAQAAAYHPPQGLDVPDDLSHTLATLCRKLGCSFLDVTPDLRRRAAQDNRRIYVKNDTHLDRDGHDETARAIVRFLDSTPGLALDSRTRSTR